MSKAKDIILTTLAPIIWGTTFIVTEKLLPHGYPVTTSVLRALPAGLLLIALTRSIPYGIWLWRSFVLGAFNFAIFLVLLFNTAYRLPGGIASTIGAIYPLVTVVLAWLMLGQRLSLRNILSGIAGLTGVALMALNNTGALDPVGVTTAVASAVSLSFGLVLTKKWHPPVSALAFTGWQMTAGGILLLPVALWYEPALPALNLKNITGFLYLGLIGGAVSYFLWFRGIAQLGPFIASSIGLVSTLTALIIGVFFAGETLTLPQMAGIALVIASVWVASVAKK
ncbi:EamA family transporter [Providencia alcalifaciens]|uniref:EamA family transporter n=1 Tax=Providencia alcalifaciens TaxID=126385 RepID=UPI001CE1E7FB|nr:EamA family transporter [Providencia alcalifaciens]UBX49287.1 EamA family transporter [Providencia alcalifaciens]